VIQHRDGGSFAMGQAIAVRTDYTSGKLRQLVKRAKDAAQARRLLAIAAVLDGASREEAATAGGLDRQTLRGWVIRFNEQGASAWSTCLRRVRAASSMTSTRRFSPASWRRARFLQSSAWCAGPAIVRLYEEFGLSVSDDTVYRALKDLGFLACEREADGL
jgi:putative transposase